MKSRRVPLRLIDDAFAVSIGRMSCFFPRHPSQFRVPLFRSTPGRENTGTAWEDEPALKCFPRKSGRAFVFTFVLPWFYFGTPESGEWNKREWKTLVRAEGLFARNPRAPR